MGRFAVLVFVIPVAELLTLLRLGELIGGLPTFLLVIASGVLGALIARAVGLRVVAQMRQAFATGAAPSEAMLDGALTLFGCALLIVPGIITDLFALALLIPFTRRAIALRVRSNIEQAVAEGKLRVVANQQRWVDPRAPRGARGVIDTEGVTVEEHTVSSEDADPKRLGS